MDKMLNLFGRDNKAKDTEINELVQLGFGREKVIEALKKANNDPQIAADYLF